MKKIVTILALMFVLSFIVFPTNATEPRLIWNLDWEGLDVKIYAPWQAYPNDTMTIRIIVEAREDLQKVTVWFNIYGSKSEGNLTWYRPLDALNTIDLSSGAVEDQNFDVDVPDDVDPGQLHAHASCSWEVWRESSWQKQSFDDICIHRVTYLRNKPYEDLQVAYNQLLADYDSLQTSYSNLQANYSILEDNHNNLQTNYGSLNSTYQSLLSDYSMLQASSNELKSKYEFAGDMANALDLMYVFIETTVIFIATTIYFVLRKQKPKKQT